MSGKLRDQERCEDEFWVQAWLGPNVIRCDLPRGHAGLHSHPYFRPGPVRRFVRRLIRFSPTARV